MLMHENRVFELASQFKYITFMYQMIIYGITIITDRYIDKWEFRSLSIL